MNNNITAAELFQRIADAISAKPPYRARIMHETLVLVCAAGLSGTGHGYGNLFSQVGELCRMCHLSERDTAEVQTMRRNSNATEPVSEDQMLYDCRALALLISAAFKTDVPDSIVRQIPHTGRRQFATRQIKHNYIRCVVRGIEPAHLRVEADSDGAPELLRIALSGGHHDHSYLLRMVHEGTQLNLLDCIADDDGALLPSIIVLEPDFLIDISTIAACFESFGHHPLLYTLNRMRPRANTQAILLGNFASTALDDIINNAQCDMGTVMRHNFRQKAVEFATCSEFDANKFKADAEQQMRNIRQAVDNIFATADRSKAILEPSFVCEQLGIQGRVDLMTTDKRLLVEQKSGANFYLQRNCRNRHGSLYIEKHYVQVLLYYGVLRYNFALRHHAVDVRLLYSKFDADHGLLSVEMLQSLFAEAIALRNRIVSAEYFMAESGFQNVIDLLRPDVLNTEGANDSFYHTYLLPQLLAVSSPLALLSDVERTYFCRMMTFVLREQQLSKVGMQEGMGSSGADLWNMPLAEKIETGNIYTNLCIIERTRSDEHGGFDTITLGVPEQSDDFLPNFRRGDMVYLYAYHKGKVPDVRHSILFKGVLADIDTDRIVVHLNDAQQNPNVFVGGSVYAVEHASSDISSAGMMASLYQFITAGHDRRNLLLSQRQPRRDESIGLSRSYDARLDDILLRAKQAKDYFLLVGPPGTGKTSCALRYIVEEELATNSGSVLLMSYTNRAVDEICDMLTTAGIDFMRIGNEYSCDPQYRQHLVSHAIDGDARLAAITSRLHGARVVVGTTSTLMARPFVFALKRFTLAVIDEAGQITEPNIIGLLAAHNAAQPDMALIERFILVGDYKQLPAVVQQSPDESAVTEECLRGIGVCDCRDSLFERLIRHERSAGRTDFIGVLRRQGRMHPDVADFPNRMFYFSERLITVPLPHQSAKSLGYKPAPLDATDRLLCSKRMLFFESKACRTESMSDKANPYEARLTAQLLRRLCRLYGEGFDARRSVGVIVPYRNQIAMIRKEIDRMQMPELKGVTIDTVERYQGSQRDVIIYSFTIHSRWQIDFLAANRFVEDGHVIDRKLNVALTRARCQMIMTGNREVLSADPLFAELIDYVGCSTATEV